MKLDISAVILAGGKSDIGIEFGTNKKALIPINKKPLFMHVVEACQKAGIEDILVVGDLPKGPGYRQIGEGKNLTENLDLGARFAEHKDILILTCDLPYLTPESITKFIKDCQKEKAGIFYSICSADECKRQFPNLKRTTVKVGKASYTGGNIVLVKRDELTAVLSFIERLFAARKQPAQLAKILGMGFILRFAASRLFPRLISLQAIERQVSKITGIKVKAILADPVVGTDIDKPEQLQALLKEQSKQLQMLPNEHKTL